MNQHTKVQRLVGTAILAAIVAVLQSLAVVTRTFGLFSFSFVLVPIVIGAAIYGKKSGAFLGLVFSLMVFITGDANPFLALNIPGTIITVLLKGVACGYVAGIVYESLVKRNQHVASVAASVICPIINTGIFVLGCYAFFFGPLSQTASAGNQSFISYILISMIGINFVIEMVINIVLIPVITYIIKTVKK